VESGEEILPAVVPAVIHQYRYRPDTCGCIITQTHDDLANTWSGVPEFKCLTHASVPDGQLHEVISGAVGENKRKNLARSALLALDDFADVVIREGGSVGREFPDGLEMRWEFIGGGARSLEVRLDPEDGSTARALAVLSALPLGERTPAVTVLIEQYQTRQAALQNRIRSGMTARRQALNAGFDSQFGAGRVSVRV
jgi:hypothetical protein